MNYALIENGKVVNVIVYDGEAPLLLEVGQELVSLEGHDAWIDWTYDGETFTAPPVPDNPLLPS